LQSWIVGASGVQDALPPLPLDPPLPALPLEPPLPPPLPPEPPEPESSSLEQPALGPLASASTEIESNTAYEFRFIVSSSKVTQGKP
jgi:hypothetical protein